MDRHAPRLTLKIWNKFCEDWEYLYINGYIEDYTGPDGILRWHGMWWDPIELNKCLKALDLERVP